MPRHAWIDRKIQSNLYFRASATKSSIAKAGFAENTVLHKILYIEEGPSVGGSTHTLLHLISRLDRSRYEPSILFRYELPVSGSFDELGVETLFWRSIGGTEPSAVASPASKMPHFKTTGIYRTLWSIKKYLLEQRKDAALIERWMRGRKFSLVHTNNALSVNLAAIAASGRLHIPVVSHQRGFMRLTVFHRYMVRKVDRFVCVSNAVNRHYSAQGIDPAKLVTVHDGIDLEKYSPRRKQSNGFLVGWFARFERWKGCLVFVEAARKVLSVLPSAKFVMAGAGPEEETVKRIVSSDPIFAERFFLPGFRSDAAEMMANCDVVVNSSIEPEPLSNTALEALALGIPVVASNVGGNPEIVENGVNGFIFEEGNPERLAEAILELASDSATRERFGAAARERAERLFDARRYASEIQELYEEIL